MAWPLVPRLSREPQSRSTCPAGHVIVLSQTAHPLVCDDCGQSVPARGFTYPCAACDYDRCLMCPGEERMLSLEKWPSSGGTGRRLTLAVGHKLRPPLVLS